MSQRMVPSMAYKVWLVLVLSCILVSHQRRWSSTALRRHCYSHSFRRVLRIEKRTVAYETNYVKLGSIGSEICLPRSKLQMTMGGSDITFSSEQLLDRAGALDKAAGYIQKLYWAQFADDSYVGRRQSDTSGAKNASTRETDSAEPVDQPTEEQSLHDMSGSDYSKMPRAPTTEPLVPVTGVRYQINAIADVLRQYDSGNISNDEAIDQIIARLGSSELSSTTGVRRAFNKYTQAIRFGDSFQINLPEGSNERRRYIQDNYRLLTAETVITADLDLRDLHRNQILTFLDDLRAETAFLNKSSQKGGSMQEGQDESNSEDPFDELRRIVCSLVSECDTWFSFIPPPDVKAAYDVYTSLIS